MSWLATGSRAERSLGRVVLVVAGGTLLAIALASVVLLVRAGLGVGAISIHELGLAALGTLGLTGAATLIAGPIGVAVATGVRWMLRGAWREVARKGVGVLAELPPIAWAIAALLIVPVPTNAWVAWFEIAVVLGLASAPVVARESLRHFDRVPMHVLLQAVALGASPLSAVSRIALPMAAPGLLRAVGMGALRAMGDTFVVVILVHGLPSLRGLALPGLVLNQWQSTPNIAYAAAALWLVLTIAAHQLFTGGRPR